MHAAASRNVTGNPTADPVYLQLQVFGVRGVDTKKQTIEVEIWFRAMWHDRRLQYPSFSEGGCFTKPSMPEGEVQFPGTELDNLWKPGIEIANVAETELGYSAFWLYPEGLVWWTRKLILQLDCSMNFAHLPFDTQFCPMQVIGFKDVEYEVEIRLFNESMGGGSKMTNPQKGTAEWDLIGITNKPMDKEATGSVWGGLGLVWEFEVRRKSAYYLKYVIFPNGMLVAVAWMSFFISRAAAPARVAMTLVCFLTISTQFFSVLTSLPRLAGDIWLINYLMLTQCFVFYAIAEYAACNMLGRVKVKIDKAREDGELARLRLLARCCCVKRNGHMVLTDHALEQISRVLYPVIFAISTGIMFALNS